MSDWCKSCGNFKFSDHHQCPPLWEVAPIEGKEIRWDEHGLFHAHYAEEAAEVAAKEWDDYAENPEDRRVAVRKVGSTEYELFETHAEHTIKYNASQITEDELED